MSGFAIEFCRSGAGSSIVHANRMAAALRPFGDDRKASVTHGPFAIAWVQSAGFTPQDRFDFQPASARERWHLVMVGRLAHRDELAEKLAIEAQQCEKLPDCELVMRAWCKWGEACRDHLFGSYSVAICDSAERRITAFRSQERSQHIYWYRDRNRLILATSPKAIFAFPDIAREIDDLKLADLLVLNHEDATRSFFRNVSVLGSSRMMVTGLGDDEPRITYHDPLSALPEIRYGSDEEYVEHARELLGRAVKSAFRTPGLPAVSLSAGLDSTAMTVAMIEHMRGEGVAASGALKSYTGVPQSNWDGRVRADRLGDESGPVRAFAAMYPELDPHFVSAEGVPGDREVVLIETYADMPVRAASDMAWGSEIWRQSRADGHRVIVSGVGGNGSISMAAAHGLFARWFRTGRWLKLLREARLRAASNADARPVSSVAQAAIANLPDPLYDRYLQFRGYDANVGFEAFSAIHPGFAHDARVRERLAQKGWDDRYRPKNDRREMLRTMLMRGARNDTGGLIEPYRAMTGIEGVAPLEDRKLVEFCYAIPDDQFYAGGVDRRLVKRMMAGKLPREVLTAPRGEEGSDWHSRRERDLSRLREEIVRLADIPSIANRIDTARILRVIDNWPAETPVSANDYPEYVMARHGIGRALSVARFVNQVEGRN